MGPLPTNSVHTELGLITNYTIIKIVNMILLEGVNSFTVTGAKITSLKACLKILLLPD